MLIQFSSMFLYEYSLDRIAKACKKAEYGGIEFWIETPHYWIDRDFRKIEEISDSITSLHCAIFDLNPCSVNQDVAEATLKSNLHAASVASRLRVGMTIHAGKRSARREPVIEDVVANEKYFRVLSKYSKIKGVELFLENSEPRINYLCRSYEDVIECAERFGFRLTFDINHALKNGDAEKYLESVERIKNVHISGNSRGLHSASRYDRNVRDILQKLADLGYSSMVTVELDDLAYGQLSFEKKIEELVKERRFIESVFKR
ncbi:TIM barrel protein [Geoglobus acetivorans]|uniref:Sugar phosphate isomerase/epimerase n=1 Tax=Geoglobus acetivorans TaxID=565033 RepID=A0ABZ3H4B0_GEOAI|nr:sugar phosphate isomerase/epimerase [Geoglobus acetivorans]